jgi:Fe-S-cluster containining protein
MFNCSGCGECCKRVGNNDLTKHLALKDGECKYLRDNKCTIYDRRPIFCRIDEGYEVYFSKVMSKEEFYELNYKECERLQK